MILLPSFTFLCLVSCAFRPSFIFVSPQHVKSNIGAISVRPSSSNPMDGHVSHPPCEPHVSAKKQSVFPASSVPLTAQQLATDLLFYYSKTSKSHIDVIFTYFFYTLLLSHFQILPSVVAHFCLDFPAVFRLHRSLMPGWRHVFNVHTCL